MKRNISRRGFLSSSASIGLGCTLIPSKVCDAALSNNSLNAFNYFSYPVIKRGEKQLFVDDVMIENIQGLQVKTHSAKKLEQPVLEAEMPWEQGVVMGEKDRRVYIYGTVIRDEVTGKFRMWYNRNESVLFAISDDGIHWDKPNLKIVGDNNLVNLKMHSPSIIYDHWEKDPSKRYKAVGSSGRDFSNLQLLKLKNKFELVDWVNDNDRRLYYAAYSDDGLHWTDYPEPILLSADTITMSQDPLSGDFLVFHKRQWDPRVKGRQIFLSTSKDMLKWSEPKLVMQTDEVDHKQARLVDGGTHSEFYNMSAFPYGSQWLGLVTHFMFTGLPKVKGPGQSLIDGPVDVQLVHSRDGRNWERCMDRSPVIPIGPHYYDGGTILGVCNSPVIVGDEMWIYYSAMTTKHGGAFPEKEFSIAVAKWRIDGMSSLHSDDNGFAETNLFFPEGNDLSVNANISNGELCVEVLNMDGEVIPGYDKKLSKISRVNEIKLPVRWDGASLLNTKEPIKLRFYLGIGDLFSYTID
jgi:hypothetical protein